MRAFVKLTVFINRCEAANCNMPENDYNDKPMKIKTCCTQYANIIRPEWEMDKLCLYEASIMKQR